MILHAAIYHTRVWRIFLGVTHVLGIPPMSLWYPLRIFKSPFQCPCNPGMSHVSQACLQVSGATGGRIEESTVANHSWKQMETVPRWQVDDWVEWSWSTSQLIYLKHTSHFNWFGLQELVKLCKYQRAVFHVIQTSGGAQIIIMDMENIDSYTLALLLLQVSSFLKFWGPTVPLWWWFSIVM